MDYSFPRAHRLITKRDFQYVFDKPIKQPQRIVMGLCRPTERTYAPRLGIIVGKNVAKLAVVRNRIKRIIRESFRLHKDKLKGLDIIVLMRSQCTPLDNNLDKIALRDNINRLWQALAKLHRKD